MTSFHDVQLDNPLRTADLARVGSNSNREQGSVAARIRDRVQRGGERTWRLSDFVSLPPGTTIRALSRLASEHELVRVARGIYFRPRATVFGPSQPSPGHLLDLASERTALFPAGPSAAALLGLSTQIPRCPEYATPSSSVPRQLVGDTALVHTRRPLAWQRLRVRDAAVLDVLRSAGRHADATDLVDRVVAILLEPGLFARLLAVSATEPPRVRALLGALGERAGRPKAELERLRRSLNTLSRFDFGSFVELENRDRWQAKRRSAA